MNYLEEMLQDVIAAKEEAYNAARSNLDLHEYFYFKGQYEAYMEVEDYIREIFFEMTSKTED